LHIRQKWILVIIEGHFFLLLSLMLTSDCAKEIMMEAGKLVATAFFLHMM